MPVRHRRGVALLITLVTVAMIMVMIATLLSAVDSVRKDSKKTEAILQANLYYADIAKILKNIDPKMKQNIFDLLYMVPIPFTSEDGTVTILLSCKPLTGGVNINWLDKGSDTNVTGLNPKYAITQELFEKITMKYRLMDSDRLQEMILEEITGVPSDLQSVQNRLMKKKGIISYRQFKGIVDRYQMEADDPEVDKVPWEKLFSFVSTAQKIDANGYNVSAELLALLTDMDVGTIRNDDSQNIQDAQSEGRFRQFVDTYSPPWYEEYKSVFTEEFVEYAQCDIMSDFGEERYRFSFDDIAGEVKNFEFHGRQ